jgi:hypothetical protein
MPSATGSGRINRDGMTQLRPSGALPCDGYVERRNHLPTRRGPGNLAFRGAAPRGPIIDQDGRSPQETLGPQAGGFQPSSPRRAPIRSAISPRAAAGAARCAVKRLDVAFIVPGTNIRYGIDGLIGLIPVVGDLITTAISLWLVREARALGAPWQVTARMLGNVALDGVVGLVPVAGDAFDVIFRANVRNVRMLKRWMDKQPVDACQRVARGEHSAQGIIQSSPS